MSLKSCALLFGSLVLLLFSAQIARSCQCPNQPTVLQSYNYSENVFTAQIVAVGQYSDNKYYSYGARFLVKKVYKGNLKEGAEVIFYNGGGSDCREQFYEGVIGINFLIYDIDTPKYMRESNIPKQIWGCGRSTILQGVNRDINYLDNFEKLRGRTRIYGSAFFARDSKPSKNIKIKIIGRNKTYETTADSNGFYEIYDLPAGEYLIEPQVFDGWKISDDFLRRSSSFYYRDEENKNPKIRRFPVSLVEKSDASLDFLYVADNAVSGRLIGASGKPLKGICVTAVRADDPKLEYAGLDCTDEQGHFEITELNPDKYIFVIKPGEVPQSSQPKNLVFYPGVTNREQSQIISISPGEKKVLKDFRIDEIGKN